MIFYIDPVETCMYFINGQLKNHINFESLSNFKHE